MFDKAFSSFNIANMKRSCSMMPMIDGKGVERRKSSINVRTEGIAENRGNSSIESARSAQSPLSLSLTVTALSLNLSLSLSLSLCIYIYTEYI